MIQSLTHLAAELQDALNGNSKGPGCPRCGNLVLVEKAGKIYCPECGKDCS
jgi:DNA-directed RNA polymerase subunit RPC12/RpoP